MRPRAGRKDGEGRGQDKAEVLGARLAGVDGWSLLRVAGSVGQEKTAAELHARLNGKEAERGRRFERTWSSMLGFRKPNFENSKGYAVCYFSDAGRLSGRWMKS